MQAASILATPIPAAAQPGLHTGGQLHHEPVTTGHKIETSRLTDPTGLQPLTRWQRIKREPLSQFLLVGVLIFLIAHVIEQAQITEQRRIVIDTALKQRIVQLQTTQTGVSPGAKQLATLVENYIDDEVQYREARRMGLEQDDEIVRRRLIQKLGFLQRDLATVPTPTEAQLRAYFDAHRNSFSLPARVSFTHLYFSPDSRGADEAHQRAEEARRSLANGARSEQLGDSFPLQHAFAGFTRIEAAQVFGSTAIVDALFTAPPGQWSEPVRSGYGWHLVQISERAPATVPPYTTVRAQVLDAYLQDASAAANRRQLETLRSRYDIVRASDEPRS